MNQETGKQIRTSEVLGYLVSFIILSLLLGVVGAGMLLPATAIAGGTVKTGLSTFDELPDDFNVTDPSERSEILAEDGSHLASFYAEDRIIVPDNQISEAMKHAIVATEDRRFYQHHGVDGQGILRAAGRTIFSNDRQGASTLTQQLVKNTLIESGIQNGDQHAVINAKVPTIGRKLREINYALALEKRWSKDQILTRYLNIAPFGPNVYGVEVAALRYFSVHAKDLTPAQAALIAGITKSPIYYDPLKHPDNATSRRNIVAGLMLEEGYITKEQHDQIIATPVEKMLKPSAGTGGCVTAGNAAYFCEYVIAELLNNEALGKTKGARRSALMRGGLTIKTSLNPKLQALAFQSITKNVPIGDPSNVKIAINSIEPGTGWIRAMAQNTNYGLATKDDKTRDYVSYNADYAHRGGNGQQPGSSFKPMTLGAWFTDQHSAYETAGGKYTWQPQDFSSSCPEAHTIYKPWTVKNSGLNTPAATNAIRAAQYSINTSFVGMASKLGDLCKIRDFAIKAGAVDGHGKIDSFSPSSVIGTGSVPPLNMTTAYATLAAHGNRCRPAAIVEIKDRNGDLIDAPKPQCEQTIDPKVADKVSLVLEQTNAAYSKRGYANIGRPAATKTGTTQNHWDTWLAGYTPQLATVVWTGHSKGLVPLTNIKINGRYWKIVWGSDISATAWTQYMRQALEGVPVEQFNKVDLGTRPVAAHTANPSKETQENEETETDTAPPND